MCLAPPEMAPAASTPGLDGIFLTHGHMGHYTGLLYLGLETMGARGVPVYAMPRMTRLLRENAPWELLLRLETVELRPLTAGKPVSLTPELRLTPFRVPHRDEYTETDAAACRRQAEVDSSRSECGGAEPVLEQRIENLPLEAIS